jgi:hypothetical protein
MPATSKAQRRFLAMAEHDPKFAQAHGIHMTHQQLHDFASTKETKLPEHVKGKKKGGYQHVFFGKRNH